MEKINRNSLCPCGSGSKYKNCCLKRIQQDNNTFIFTKHIFENDFYPFYDINNRDELNTLITFDEIVLPFYIPFHTGRTLTISFEELGMSFRFDKVTISESYKYLNSDESFLDIFKSKVTIIIAIPQKIEEIQEYEADNENNHDIFTELFDSSIEFLNKIITSYMLMSKDSSCHYLTKEMLQSMIIISKIDIHKWKSEKSIFLLHPHVPYNREPIKSDEIPELLRYVDIITADLNPFASGERHHLFAERYFKSGYYHEAVIYAQISVEVFIRQVYIELLKEADQMTSVEAINVLEETPFMSIIKKKLHNYLGGNWDINDDNTDTSKRYKKTYTLRNQSIHVGRIPLLSETAEAIEASINFRLFVLKRIQDNQRKYPKLLDYFSIK